MKDLKQRQAQACLRITELPRLPEGAARDFLAAPDRRLLVMDARREDELARMRREVEQGLADPRQNWIPPTYFYDAHGSQLFEAITALPEYYLTRSEESILERVVPNLA